MSGGRFKLRDVSSALYPPGSSLGPRRLPDYELVWIDQGNVVWECNRVEHPAPPGTMILSRRGFEEFYRWDPQGPTRHGFLHFDFNDGGREGLPPESHWPVTRQLEADDILRPLLNHLGWLQQCRLPGAEPLIQSCFALILNIYISGLNRTREPESDELPAPVLQAFEHARLRWQNGSMTPLSLKELAGAAHVSPVHLCRLFRASLGVGPQKALRLLRLQRASLLLARTNTRVKGIADACGFASPFHFSRAFHTVFGSSPRKYREQVLRGALPSSGRLPHALVGLSRQLLTH